MKIATYDSNFNGIVDTCDYVDGGSFKDDANDIGNNLSGNNNKMDKNIYDKDGNGIVDNAENIDAGEF